ncbi:MAG: periplasmic protein TonB [Candidatus Magnetoglobus multicellularis str. Araruama]|uniref:Periplasmic protein TonB n=1 Tax=Candidatus Magnetoglobus multicellularis str. Araruama TaxID=890399 RepID=A0A1V1P4Q7_9BACT|nr:MAG: periplasmic protein TonB [Candidatus Magnetoglobus multicellularis str. Araruama]
MDIGYLQSKSINWLLLGLIGISIAIHAVVFYPIIDLFQDKSIRYIEFSLEEKVKPYYRSIPRPRRRHKIPQITDTKAFHVRDQKKMIVNKVPEEFNLPKEFSHSIDAPSVPDVPNMPDIGDSLLTQWQPASEIGTYYTKKEYYEMLKMSIESHKKYPQFAQNRNIEGHVKVEFEIIQGGKVNNIKIVKSSGRKILDRAAMDAIKNASPFPVPPRQLFKLPLKLAIVIVFELT